MICVQLDTRYQSLERTLFAHFKPIRLRSQPAGKRQVIYTGSSGEGPHFKRAPTCRWLLLGPQPMKRAVHLAKQTDRNKIRAFPLGTTRRLALSPHEPAASVTSRKTDGLTCPSCPLQAASGRSSLLSGSRIGKILATLQIPSCFGKLSAASQF